MWVFPALPPRTAKHASQQLSYPTQLRCFCQDVKGSKTFRGSPDSILVLGERKTEEPAWILFSFFYYAPALFLPLVGGTLHSVTKYFALLNIWVLSEIVCFKPKHKARVS